MNKSVYFISGLPRSGSTLLSAILNQNPRFYSGPSSPVITLMKCIANFFNTEKLCLAYPKVAQAEMYIGDLIKYYYAEVKQEVIFDKSRIWTSNIESIEYYFKIKPKIICMVRNIDEIYMSIKNTKADLIDELLSPNDTLLLKPYNCLKEAFNNYRNYLHIVEYNDLVDKPKEVMQNIYKFLGEEYYEHTFYNIEQKYKEDDINVYGIDLHTIRPDISKSTTKPTKDIINRCKGMEFWR